MVKEGNIVAGYPKLFNFMDLGSNFVQYISYFLPNIFGKSFLIPEPPNINVLTHYIIFLIGLSLLAILSFKYIIHRRRVIPKAYRIYNLSLIYFTIYSIVFILISRKDVKIHFLFPLYPIIFLIMVGGIYEFIKKTKIKKHAIIFIILGLMICSIFINYDLIQNGRGLSKSYWYPNDGNKEMVSFLIKSNISGIFSQSYDGLQIYYVSNWSIKTSCWIIGDCEFEIRNESAVMGDIRNDVINIGKYTFVSSKSNPKLEKVMEFFEDHNISYNIKTLKDLIALYNTTMKKKDLNLLNDAINK
ncbi:MAG: hypothetical protein ABIC04_01775 [Nanoarchaeota archaeon]